MVLVCRAPFMILLEFSRTMKTLFHPKPVFVNSNIFFFPKSIIVMAKETLRVCMLTKVPKDLISLTSEYVCSDCHVNTCLSCFGFYKAWDCHPGQKPVVIGITRDQKVSVAIEFIYATQHQWKRIYYVGYEERVPNFTKKDEPLLLIFPEMSSCQSSIQAVMLEQQQGCQISLLILRVSESTLQDRHIYDIMLTSDEAIEGLQMKPHGTYFHASTPYVLSKASCRPLM